MEVENLTKNVRDKLDGISMHKRTEKKFYFSRGNRKLASSILTWDLPAISTCIGSSEECRKYCYALKSERCYPFCLPSRERNLVFSKTKQFISSIVKYLKSRKEHIIRIHSSGDFYNNTYFQKWKEIATQCKDKTFYCYTKSFSLFNVFEKLPQNLIVIQSYGSIMDDKIDPKRSTARVIRDISERLPHEFICPSQMAKLKGKNIKCGSGCSLCFNPKLKDKIHVAFLLH